MSLANGRGVEAAAWAIAALCTLCRTTRDDAGALADDVVDDHRLVRRVVADAAGMDGATVAAAATGAAPHGDYVDGGDEPWLTQNGHNASALRGATQVAASQPLPSKAAAGVKAGVTSAPRRASEGAVNKRAGLVLEGQRGAPVANSNSVIICSQPPGATALTTTTVASAAADGGDSTPMFHCRYCEYSSRVSHSVTTHERRVSARCFL